VVRNVGAGLTLSLAAVPKEIGFSSCRLARLATPGNKRHQLEPRYPAGPCLFATKSTLPKPEVRAGGGPLRWADDRLSHPHRNVPGIYQQALCFFSRSGTAIVARADADGLKWAGALSKHRHIGSMRHPPRLLHLTSIYAVIKSYIRSCHTCFVYSR
jgi:hypothetical protein